MSDNRLGMLRKRGTARGDGMVTCVASVEFLSVDYCQCLSGICDMHVNLMTAYFPVEREKLVSL